MIPTAPFGRTNHFSTRTVFGAAALGQVTQAEADHVLEVLLEYGINHIDTAASYGDSELRIGPWMAQHRNDFFLATKTGERTYAAAKEQLHRSLERLRVDHVDLIQLHYLVPEDEWATAMGPGGALEALVEARDEGLVRFIGVTGHDWTVPAMHLRSLERFDFDTVLLPYSYIVMQNTPYAVGFERLLQVCQARNVAVQTIKSISRGPWPQSATRTHATWYEPMSEQAEIDLAVNWVLGREGVFLNTVGDIHLLPKVLDAASRFQSRPDSDLMAAQVERQGMAPIFTA